ncbi:hypothetical protein HY419_01530, partial [candidate division WWE3 bacterium]|nr:hypothetical protein [candidate division WWE3 bacterium]
MNIAIVVKSTTFQQGYGGLEVQNRLLAEGLAQAGNKVTVYSPKKQLMEALIEGKGVLYKFIDLKERNEGFLQSVLNPGVKNKWYRESFLNVKKDHGVSQFDVLISQS